MSIRNGDAPKSLRVSAVRITLIANLHAGPPYQPWTRKPSSNIRTRVRPRRRQSISIFFPCGRRQGFCDGEIVFSSMPIFHMCIGLPFRMLARGGSIALWRISNDGSGFRPRDRLHRRFPACVMALPLRSPGFTGDRRA